MKIYNSGDKICESIVLLGMFDGIHLGHMSLIEKAVSLKQSMGYPVIMYTFDVNPKADKKRLMSNEDKVRMCGICGIDGIYFESFDENFRKTSPEEFVENILVDKLSAKAVVVGDDYRFGFMGKGCPSDLSGFGFDVFIMPQLKDGDAEISSSAIRGLIEECDILSANELLGYTYSLPGKVVHGRGVGRTFGVCTANVDVDSDFVLPGDGVYITKIFVNDTAYPSLTNIGFKPTFGLDFRTVEVHIPDFDGDLYGEAVRLEFIDYLRSEAAFSSADELKNQIEKDILDLRGYYE